MSKASPCRRNKLKYDIMHSNISDTDKVIFFTMCYKFVDGEQLLEFLEKQPTIEQVKEYVEDKLRGNRIKRG